MAEAGVKLEGLEETLRVLRTLPERIAKRAVKKAVNAGASPFVKHAKRNAPRGNGLFKRSLTKVVRTYRGPVYLAVIGQHKGKSFQSRRKKKLTRGGISGRGDLVPIHFVEEDTRPHEIDGPLAIDGAGAVRVVRRANHPGTRGQHPIRKAARSSEREAVTAFTSKLSTEVVAEADKVKVN